MKFLKTSGKIKCTFFLFTLQVVLASAQISIENLQVEYQSQPLGIDIATPRISWQMVAGSNKRGIYQTAYQISVTDESGREVWDTGKVESNISLGVTYAGQNLQQSTKYDYIIKVWDQEGIAVSNTSWFET